MDAAEVEGIETLREKNKGITPPNSFNELEQWQSTLFPFFEKDKPIFLIIFLLDVFLTMYLFHLRKKDQKTAHTIVCRNIIKKKLEVFI